MAFFLGSSTVDLSAGQNLSGGFASSAECQRSTNIPARNRALPNHAARIAPPRVSHRSIAIIPLKPSDAPGPLGSPRSFFGLASLGSIPLAAFFWHLSDPRQIERVD